MLDHRDLPGEFLYRKANATQALTFPDKVRSKATMGASRLEYRGQAHAYHWNSRCNAQDRPVVKRSARVPCQADPTDKLAAQTNGSWPFRGLTVCLFSLRRESKQYLPKV